MQSKVKIGLAVAILSAIGISGNIYKNTVISEELDKNIQKNLKTESKLKYKDIVCSGLTTVNCAINEPILKIDDNSSITATSFIINDISEYEKFKKIDKNNEEQQKEIIVDTLKNGTKFSVNIQNLNVYSSTQNREKIKEKIISQLSKDSETNFIIKNLVKKLDSAGISGDFKFELTGKELIVEEVITTGLTKSSLTAIISYDGTKINNVNDIENVAKDAIFQELKIHIEDKSEVTLSSLYILYKNLAYSNYRRDIDIVRSINNQYSFNGNGKNLSYEKFKKILGSKVTDKLINDSVYQITKDLKSKFNNKELYTGIDNIAKKVKGIVKGDKDLTISIKSELSAKIFENELQNALLNGQTNQSLSKLIKFEIM